MFHYLQSTVVVTLLLNSELLIGTIILVDEFRLIEKSSFLEKLKNKSEKIYV